MNKVYGTSDDLIEIEGELNEEINVINKAVLLIFNDGTILIVKYGKLELAIWEITILKKGELFDHIEKCDNQNADIYSDIVYFKKGIKWCYSAINFSKITGD